jgi:hypothetical protein
MFLLKPFFGNSNRPIFWIVVALNRARSGDETTLIMPLGRSKTTVTKPPMMRQTATCGRGQTEVHYAFDEAGSAIYATIRLLLMMRILFDLGQTVAV